MSTSPRTKIVKPAASNGRSAASAPTLAPAPRMRASSSSIWPRGTFTQISQVTGISRSHISRILRGRVLASSISIDTAQRIADALGVGVEELSAKLTALQEQQPREDSAMYAGKALPLDTIIAMRSERKNGATCRELEAKYGVSRTTISTLTRETATQQPQPQAPSISE